MSLRALVDVLERSEATKATRLVLLALADHAHDDGSNAFPAVSTLARKARCDERTVQRALRWLEEACEIARTGTTRHGVTVWHLTVVAPLAIETGIEGGDKMSPEVDLLKGRLEGSGGNLPPDYGATNCRPEGDILTLPLAVEKWIGKHGLGFSPDDARDVLRDNFHLRDDRLDRAVALLDERRRRLAR